MPISTLKKFLDEHHVKYVLMSHSTAYTAQEVAAAAHIPGKELAKTVMVDLDGKAAMAVVPASYRINFRELAKATGAAKVRLLAEKEFEGMFPGCEVGAMPPFGNLWNLPVYVSETLAEDAAIAFNAGTHSEVMRLAFDDFRRLVEPTILKFSEHT